MNKQQLASKIWESANKMRSKIEANEYKDYILGFIFYKFLSDRELSFLKNEGYQDEDIKELNENSEADINFCKNNLGYFIGYNDLFSTWLEEGQDFTATSVREALNRFERNIEKNYNKVFSGIFNTLQTGLSKLGDTQAGQNKAVRDLIKLIRDIPMDGKQDYDVLGFIYEYLISNFAANAGKKAGEFYTPHEVSLLMSEIIANHLKDRSKIDIYDPTSGSGSLLINIGKAASKYINGENKIVYYAQELKQNTYNLTRMNLIMRGIIPSNIFTRNGDTLEDDWPYFDDSDPEGTYNPLFVDAVVSNPPYSQNWDPTDRDTDPRYKEYGLAPKSKADYAFLLHDLYHLKGDGIMTIVLPHGVLFRGGEEGEIRKNLVEKNNIDCIIGLPANIFFGTGIPTIIMVLKKQSKKDTNIQIIDASKGFIKEGKNNKLRACDIKKIVDCVIKRENIDKFSRVVSREEIRNNDYNLNIPRYVDSNEEQEHYDIYASMFGGIPSVELDKFNKIWNTFPELKNKLFEKVNEKYYKIKSNDFKKTIENNNDTKKFKETFKNDFVDFEKYLENNLLANKLNIKINSEEKILSDLMFEKLNQYNLVDNYKAYQILDDNWNTISSDLEIIQTEGLDAVRTYDEDHSIISLDLIQNYKLKDKLDTLESNINKLTDITANYENILDELSEENKQDITNDAGDKIDFKLVANKVKQYKSNKIEIEKESDEEKICNLDKLHNEEKKINKQIKDEEIELQKDGIKAIENLSDSEIDDLLNIKWIKTLINSLNKLPEEIINDFIKDIENVSKKYDTTLIDLDKEIKETENTLSNMINELTGDEFDIKGLEEFKSLLGGE